MTSLPFPHFDSRLINMFLGCLVGDAFGMGYEFRGTREEIAQTLATRPGYLPHILQESSERAALARKFNFIFHYDHIPGTLSDDAQSTMGVTEALLDPRKLDKALLVEKMKRVYLRDKVPGYSSRIEEIFLQDLPLDETLDALTNRNQSVGNGAAIRALPFGVFSRVSDVIRTSTMSAEITHDTSVGRDSSVLVSLMSHAVYHGKMKASFAEGGLYDYVMKYKTQISPESVDLLREVHRVGKEYPRHFGTEFFNIGGVSMDGIPCHGMQTVGAVLYLLEQFGHAPHKLLKQSVLLGGDTDSVAAIAMGLAALCNGLDSMPGAYFYALWSRIYRKVGFMNLGLRLGQKYPARVTRGV